MRVQSIISSFVLVLGNFILHFALAYLAGTVVMPTQEEIDALEKGSPAGEFECVSADDLAAALQHAKNIHWVTFGFLLYVRNHGHIWTRIVGYFRENRLCCYEKANLRILEHADIMVLGKYS